MLKGQFSFFLSILFSVTCKTVNDMCTVASTPNAGCSGAGTQFVHVFVTLSSLLACLAPLETKKKKRQKCQYAPLLL